jgi:hypothetical protein
MVTVFFKKRGSELSMPKTEDGVPNRVGTRYYGPVLTGRKPVDQRAPRPRADPNAESDPVLRWHQRMDE